VSARGDELRERLAGARLMLIFTPELCRAGAEPLAVLTAALPSVDAVQVRVIDAELGRAPARASCDWTRTVLALAAEAGALVLVNDRVDVAAALGPEGLAGVHLGAGDAPPALARELLGPDALVGLSTHSPADVARATAEPVDYLGFGPVFATATKGYAHGLGPEAAWVASRGTALPLFPIGGIDVTNAGELAGIGRAAVCAAILGAEDPGAAARELRELLTADE
jgi:thiamine-phosphate pyrophosphorylase